jgi:RNA polymerase sigma factor (sigma-70 family)
MPMRSTFSNFACKQLGLALAYNNIHVEAEMHDIIQGCVQQNRAAQEKLYKLMYPKMMSMVRRYIDRDRYQLGEEILNNGFLKVFQKIDTYKYEGSFEGWVRRVVFHSLSDYIRQNIKYMEKVVLVEKDVVLESTPASNFAYNDIMKLVQSLPDTSRAVFNMYAMEGFSHKEIAAELGISEGTSKWHLFEARKTLKIKLEQNNISRNG